MYAYILQCIKVDNHHGLADNFWAQKVQQKITKESDGELFCATGSFASSI